MFKRNRVVIIVENSFVPLDTRVRYEATSLHDAGWQVTVVCPAPTGNYAHGITPVSFGKSVDMDGVRVFYFPLKPAGDGVVGYLLEYFWAFISIARLTWRIFRQDGFDILHICNPPDIFFPLALFYRMLGVRIIYDHHDLFPEFVTNRYRGLVGKLFYSIAQLTEFLTHRSANLTIATNESYRKIALSRGHVPAERVTVVRNGPKLSEFCPVDPVPSLKKGSKYLACYVGIMGFEDGVLEMIEAIRRVIQDFGRKDVRFVLIGDGALRPKALELVESWGLSQYVDMPGMVRDKLVIRQYLSTADLCLSPEPLSPLNAKSTFIKIGEYMAIGKPIVAFNLDETRWTAQDAALFVETGNVAGFAQAIVTLLDDPEKRRRMGECAKERISTQLCWERQQENLLKAYASLR